MSAINALVDMHEALTAAASAAAGALATHPELGLAAGALSLGLWRLRATSPAAAASGLPNEPDAAPPSLSAAQVSSAADPLAERAALSVSTPGGGE